MAAARCFASALSGALLSRAAARHSLRPNIILPLLEAPFALQQRLAAPRRLRVMSSASQPYWNDESKRVQVYQDYTIYKGKAAMSVKVIKPTWEHVGSGLAISREGTVLLEFAPAVATQQYNWQQKETFALSALECAAVLEAADARQGCEFFHDPNKGSAAEGAVQKSLSIKPADKGWFFSLNVNTGGSKSYISCNVSEAELRLIKVVLNFLMPRLLGFDEHFAGAPTVAAESSTTAAVAAAEGERAPF